MGFFRSRRKNVENDSISKKKLPNYREFFNLSNKCKVQFVSNKFLLEV